MRGAYALAYLFDGEENLLIGARRGAPLAVGYGEGEMYLGSDALALAPFTDLIAYLEEGDWVVLTREGAEFHDASGKIVTRRKVRSPAGGLLIEKGNYRHFMAKEIHEQPEVVGHTLAHYVDMGEQRVRLFAWPVDPAELSRITICACGTAYMAGLIGKYWIERFARLPVEIDVASEYRYREAPVDPSGVTIVISQSGETADTLASLRYAKERRQQHRRRRQRADLEHRAAQRQLRADARRPGDRRRLDQGVHLPARRDGGAGDQSRPRARNARRSAGGGAGRRTDRRSRPDRRRR